MILINGQPDSMINVSDRGLQYGDGLFETMAYKNGEIQSLDAHMERLFQGCQRLAIPLDIMQLKAELALICAQTAEDSVIKIIVTRGEGGRGYKASKALIPTRIIARHDMPDYPIENQSGIKVRLCQTRLGLNPALAGLKHLNRLEQVLARNEWDDVDIKEGLMFDINDQLIEGTMSNVFIVKAGQLYTADLDKAGVAGILRQKIIRLSQTLGLEMQIRTLDIKDLINADELFVCNSLIGIWPVTEVAETDYRYSYGPITKQLQQALKQLEQ